jgi:ATP-dependent RNA helicase SUPV3L1/SUV3
MGSLDFFGSREDLLEIVFLEDHLFPEREKFSIVFEDQFNIDSARAAIGEIDEWFSRHGGAHRDSQKRLRDGFDLDLMPDDLECQCSHCIGDYRSKLRDVVFRQSLDRIDVGVNWVQDNIEKVNDYEIRNYVIGLQNHLEDDIHSVRARLKRASLNKLDKQIKNNFRSKFSYDTVIAHRYMEKLRPFFETYLAERELDRDLIDDNEYDRFRMQLGINLWNNERFLRREFSKLVRSVLFLKRKDISSTILQDYLGQFWLHSGARQIKRKIIYHMGPTNSGKTYEAVQRLCEVSKGCYLAPLRLLASELYDTMNAKGVKTTLLTGEEVIELEGATHFSSTVEMAKFHEVFDCVVIDEIQMMSDPQRGWAWTRAFVNIFSPEVHICGDATVKDLVEKIVELTGDELEIRRYERMTKLVQDDEPITLGEMQKHDALIVFSRRDALNYKRDLETLGFKVSIVYGRLGPEVRREQARKFDEGETDIMVSTDAIAMGMNLPIKRIVFSTLSKFIDSQEYPISDSEIKQISGRSGRFKRFPKGHVTCLGRVEGGVARINEAMAAQLPQKTKSMVGPDLDIFQSVNSALSEHNLLALTLSEFLRLFNTMTFKEPFYCVDLSEMIELAEMVEEADKGRSLHNSETFGFACAPVNMGLVEHVQYYVWILNRFVRALPIENEQIDHTSDNIDYLESSIKCVELYQWLSRHFHGKHFEFNHSELMNNKIMAIERLNELLSQKLIRYCRSCGNKLADDVKFNICENCFRKRRFNRRPPQRRSSPHKKKSTSNRRGQSSSQKTSRRKRR